MRQVLFAVAASFMGMSLISAPAAAQFGSPKGKPKAELEIVSSVTKVVPGQGFDVGIRFKLARGWYIYWKNSGDSGLPPKTKWTLPTGFSAGDMEFPVPKLHLDRFDESTSLTTNILEDDPVLLIRMEAPEAIDSARVTLAAGVQYLICEKNCIRETADLALELPVAEPGSTAEPSNGSLFEAARARLPKQQSRFLSLRPSATADKLSAGATFDLIVEVDVQEGYRIPSNQPGSSKLLASHVFVEPTAGLFFEPPVFPEASLRRDRALGELSEFSGKAVIRVPVEVADQAPPEPVRLAGLLSFQPCDTQGRCEPPEAVTFCLTLGEKGITKIGASTGASPVIAATPPPPTDVERGGLEQFGLPVLLLFCFLYGLFINATPCVLPLLSIKVLGFVQQAHESRARTLALGLSFGAGVMIFFVVLGLLASRGNNVLQYPVVVIALGAIVMAMALSMLGVYTLQVPTAATHLEAYIQREGVAASFGKGALAPVLGFACTGPLLAGAFGWATRQPPHIAVVAFLAAGLGMASPYMLLGANPRWLSFLPRPGNWMITFERIMGFLLLGMVIWLLSPLVAQIGPAGLQWTLGFLVVVAMGCWLLGRVNFSMSALRRWRYRGGAAALVAIAAALVYGLIYPLGPAVERQRELRLSRYGDPADWSRGIPWQMWSQEAVERTVRAGQPVFVDFTAEWCTVCKINKKTAIDVPETRDKMKALGFVPFQGDFTTANAAVAEALQRHGRAGPPLNLIYPPGQPEAPIVLRPNLTKAHLLEQLGQAGPARTASLVGS